jgi:1-phosphofructokinase family hexose kinase
MLDVLMFLTVTPNLCIERTLEIPEFKLGQVHRVTREKVHLNAGGKGINAARVAAALGTRVLALAPVGKHQRAWFEQQLQREGVAYELIEVESDTRICTNILHGSGDKTEIVEAGASHSWDDGVRMLERFGTLLPSCELAAICGSYPTASTLRLNAHLVAMGGIAQWRGKKLIVDGKGLAFDLLMRSPNLPWAIKPNCEEAAALLKHPVQTETEEQRAVDELLDLGVEVVLLSCGERGAYLSTRQSTHFFTPPRVEETSAVGSGDAFVGAFAAQYLQSGDLVEAARWGVAAGAANASQKLSAFCSRVEIEALVAHVEVTTIR